MKKISKLLGIIAVIFGLFVVASCGTDDSEVKGELTTQQTYSTIKMTCKVEDPNNKVNKSSVYVAIYNEDNEKVSTNNFTTLPAKDDAGNYKSETITAKSLTANTTYKLRFYCTIGTSEHLFEEKSVKTTDQGLSEENPILINNADELYAMTDNLNAYYKLNADIDLGIENNRSAIFSSSNPFAGHFDGNNHTISNFYTTTNNQEIGLFGNIGKKGVIKNVVVDTVKIGSESSPIVRTSETRLGAVASTNKGKLENVTAKNVDMYFKTTTSSSTTLYYLGGFVGFNEGVIDGCHVGGKFSTFIYTIARVGGFVGYDEATSDYSIKNSSSNVELSCTLTSSSSSGSEESKYTVAEYVGGFAGEVRGRIKDCYAKGSVTASYSFEYKSAVIYPLGAAIGGFAGVANEQAWIKGTMTNVNILFTSKNCLEQNIGLFIGVVGRHANADNFVNNVIVGKNTVMTLTLTDDQGVFKPIKSVTVEGETTTTEVDRTVRVGFIASMNDSFKTKLADNYSITELPTFTSDVESVVLDVALGKAYTELTLSEYVLNAIRTILDQQ